MGRYTRRKFLGSSAAVPLGLGLASVASAQGKPATGMADLIVTGGNILTMNPWNPTVEALAVRGERILAVGTNEEIIKLANASTTRVDATGMTVTPGFIDSHSHPLFAEEAIGVNVNLRRIDDVKTALAGKAAQTPPGHWVRGVMYDDTKFEDERPLNRNDIDDVVSD
ncbi:MAG: amidohydrolase, partial [Gammaproteobacteria bacterium]